MLKGMKHFFNEKIVPGFLSIKNYLKKNRKLILNSTLIFLFFLGFLIVLSIWFNPFNFEAKLFIYDNHIVNPARIDSLTQFSEKAKIIRELENEGLILTPQEYTNNVIAYYNVVLSYIGALLIIFSVIAYFQLKFVSRKEIAEILKESIKDSKEFEKALLDSIFGKLQDRFPTFEDVESIVRTESEQLLENITNRNVDHDKTNDEEINN